MTTAKPTAKPQSFKALLESDGTRLNWTIIRIPFDVPKLWSLTGLVKVSGEINGFAFRTSLFPVKGGGHMLLINKRMQAGANATQGAIADFTLRPDTAERTVTLPPELRRALSADKALVRWFSGLNYSARNDIAKWITEVKSPDARERRAEQIAERLLATMEAEHELPPILKAAFARDPRARAGWEAMSIIQRRGHLLGIFYYRTPEARARRAQKAIDEARRRAPIT